MDLTISRGEWLRGEGGYRSALVRADGKKCCLGIYLLACGVSAERMLERSSPSSIRFGTQMPDWLLTSGGSGGNSYATSFLMEHNDERTLLDEATRERLIAEEFAQHDVHVTFVD